MGPNIFHKPSPAHSWAKRDIESSADIKLMVDAIYLKAAADNELGFIFREMAGPGWSTPLPVMYNFWENVILYTGNYEGNLVNLHKHLHDIKPLNKTHFDRWNHLFIAAVNELFAGEKADLVKERGLNISSIIEGKLFECQSGMYNIY